MRIDSGDGIDRTRISYPAEKTLLHSADLPLSRDSIEISDRAANTRGLRYFSSVPAPSVGQLQSPDSGSLTQKNGEASGSSVQENGKASDAASLPMAEKSRLLDESGLSFFIGEEGSETPLRAVDVLKYCEAGSAPSQSFTVRKGDINVTLPFTSQSADSVLFFHTDANPAGLRLPRFAVSIKKLYSMDFPIYRRVKAEDGSYPFVRLDPLEACREAETLTPRRKPGMRIFFGDGDSFYEIDKEGDFERAEVLKGLSGESNLKEDERKALPAVRMMLNRGAIFTEKEFNGNKGLRTGILSIMKAIGGEGEGVYYYDSQKRKSDIRSLKDLERIGYVYYGGDEAVRFDPGQKEKSLITQIDDLMKDGVIFRDIIFDKTYGIPMVLKFVLGENKSMLAKEYVSIQDEAGRDAYIDSPEDLKRIRAIYVDRDISALPDEERELLVSLGRIYDLKGDSAPPSSLNTMGAMKGILEKNSFGSPIGIKDEKPGSGVYESLRSLKDIDRYVAIYIDRKPENLPPDEQEALSAMSSIRASGIEFCGTLDSKVPTVEILQTLKGEHPFERSVGLKYVNAPQAEGLKKSDSSLPRAGSLKDLRRIDALLIKKDPGLLCEDEYQVLQSIEKLEKHGITFRGPRDSSFISVLKALKGETGMGFMVHPDHRESMINEMRDLDRIEALYIDRDLSALPRDEAEMIQDVQFMQSAGYTCALARSGMLKEVASLDVLKSSMNGWQNVGLKDSSGAFTAVSSSDDMKHLRLLAEGRKPEFKTREEAELYRKAVALAGRGFSFKAHLEFWPQTSPTVQTPEAGDYTIGALQLAKELMKGNKSISAEKEGQTSPVSSAIECLDLFEKVEEKPAESQESPDENTIAECDGFVIVGGIKLEINRRAE